MTTAGRLALYAAGLAMAFLGAYGIAAAVVPGDMVTNRTEGTTMEDHGSRPELPTGALSGLSLSAHGYALSPVTAPVQVGEPGELSFSIIDEDGNALVAFETSHEKALHLIVVRSDGAEYRHVHPVLDATTGRWSIPWEWNEAGTYRVYADFAPSAPGDRGAATLSRTVHVAGELEPVHVDAVATTDEVDGFQVSVDGRLIAGAAGELTVTVRRNGEPVTELQPYLGAFGHLVALRDGDLAYLHVHAHGDEPREGETSGPEITFSAEAPTAGRYLLYLDFQVDGQVHTARFVLDAAPGHGGSDPHGRHGSGDH
ncbi:heavy-metal-associated domain-containing protein [Naasia sp. SYSU D00948]|uniref:heavy-metal-associated domain-containing protein n=1 Tax=Naasia sp. SYSU D00948 TaxID=2817379 RepID=UPI001B311AA5|nr:heavy-metal-associated domain-containing protein [Naasia sp. SYSU D00948]